MRRSFMFVGMMLPIVILGSIGLIKFGSLAFSSSPPTWGDGVSFAGLLLASVSAILFYIQWQNQNNKDELNRINRILDEIPNLVQTITDNGQSGSDAIVLFAKSYDKITTPHPRTVIDKVQYAILQLKLALTDLTKVPQTGEVIRMVQKACLLFYTHFYFPITVEDQNKKDLLSKLEPQYDPFKSQFQDLQRLTYSLLRTWDLVGKHHESEKYLLPGAGEANDITRIFDHFTKSE